MAVQAVPFVLFQNLGLENRNRSLRYDLNAMADFEQMTGMGLSRLMSTQAIFATTRALLWAGLKHNDRGLTIEVVGSKMQDFQDAGGEISDVLKACLKTCIEQKAIMGMKLSDLDDPDQEPAAGSEVPNDKSQPSSPSDGTSTGHGPVTSA